MTKPTILRTGFNTILVAGASPSADAKAPLDSNDIEAREIVIPALPALLSFKVWAKAA